MWDYNLAIKTNAACKLEFSAHAQVVSWLNSTQFIFSGVFTIPCRVPTQTMLSFKTVHMHEKTKEWIIWFWLNVILENFIKNLWHFNLHLHHTILMAILHKNINTFLSLSQCNWDTQTAWQSHMNILFLRKVG